MSFENNKLYHFITNKFEVDFKSIKLFNNLSLFIISSKFKKERYLILHSHTTFFVFKLYS